MLHSSITRKRGTAPPLSAMVNAVSVLGELGLWFEHMSDKN